MIPIDKLALQDLRSVYWRPAPFTNADGDTLLRADAAKVLDPLKMWLLKNMMEGTGQEALGLLLDHCFDMAYRAGVEHAITAAKQEASEALLREMRRERQLQGKETRVGP